MQLMQRITVIAFASAMLLGALGGAAYAQAPIKIGASMSTTGPLAAVGQNQLRGYQLCVKQANEKGGVLGRKLELVFYDDASAPSTAVVLYEKLITQDKVDLVLGPSTTPITDAVANVTEKHKMPMVASNSSGTSIYRKGRKFIFSMNPPAEVQLEGLIDLAARKGLKTLALLNPDNLFGRAMTQGAIELAKKKGLQVVLVDAYPDGSTDFSTILAKVQAANPDVPGVATRYEDAVAITRQMKALNLNPKMTGLTVGVDLPKFHEALGRDL